MLRVAFQFDDVEESCEVDRASSLADVQQLLCRLYRQSFPAKKAVLTSDNTYDAFVQYPFKACSEGAIFEVKFENTDEVLFYDKFNRIGMKIELEEEVAYDDAVAAGTTHTGIEAWVMARRAALLRTA